MTFKDPNFQLAMNIVRDMDTHPGNFTMEGGRTFAGRHLLIDFFGASKLTSPKHTHDTILRCVNAIQATLLNIHVHDFGKGKGVSAVAMLAESHISMHSWPEESFVSIDIFTCGQCVPKAAIPILNKAYTPKLMNIQEYFRGERPLANAF